MDRIQPLLAQSPVGRGAVAAFAIGLVIYLTVVNNRMRGVPDDMKRLKQKPWTVAMLKEAYARLEKNPITVETTKDRLPPKLSRRYIVVGGNGLVGGYIVLQLLARGQPPESIRIVDCQKMHRKDMLEGPAAELDVVHTDISSVASTDAAFTKAWPPSVAKLPLTVFHTAAVMVPSDRSQSAYTFLERINIEGTRNVLAAARKAGADVLISTASGSIAVRPVEFWMAPWRLFGWPKHFVQQLNEADFRRPLRPFSKFYSAYAASKATAERIVCDANCKHLRTGTIRPANGIYGHPTDSVIGSPLNRATCPVWSYNIVNSFIHGMNSSLAHLNLEAVLADPRSSTMPQAGRPFTVTDPNAPIQFQDMYLALAKLSVTPFRTVPMIPVHMLITAYMIEFYMMLPRRFPFLKHILPKVSGDTKHLQPALFSIVTHLYATNDPASRSVKEGGIGYCGAINTMDGMVQQLVDWNNEHIGRQEDAWVRYKSSLALADEFEQIGATATDLQKQDQIAA